MAVNFFEFLKILVGCCSVCIYNKVNFIKRSCSFYRQNMLTVQQFYVRLLFYLCYVVCFLIFLVIIAFRPLPLLYLICHFICYRTSSAKISLFCNYPLVLAIIATN